MVYKHEDGFCKRPWRTNCAIILQSWRVQNRSMLWTQLKFNIAQEQLCFECGSIIKEQSNITVYHNNNTYKAPCMHTPCTLLLPCNVDSWTAWVILQIVQLVLVWNTYLNFKESFALSLTTDNLLFLCGIISCHLNHILDSWNFNFKIQISMLHLSLDYRKIN